MSKILIILRESTERQEIESQKEQMITYCQELGYNLDSMCFLLGKGASARKANKKYIDWLDSIKDTVLSNKEIEAVAVWHLNRLGRIESYLMYMKEFFIKNKIQVYVKNPNITLLKEDGTPNPASEISWSIFAALVKFETEEMFEKIKRGKERIRKTTRYSGGAYIQYGYKLDENGYLIPNYDNSEGYSEVDVVKMIFNEYSTGKYSVRKLAIELNKRGIRNRGKKLNAQFINKLLVSTCFIGHNENDKPYTPIIDEELFNKVRDIRKSNVIIKEVKHRSLALKVLVCPYCGSNYIYSSGSYLCYRRKTMRDRDNPCMQSVAIKKEVMDDLLWKEALREYTLFNARNKEESKQKIQKEILLYKDKINGIDKLLIEATEKLKRLSEVYLNLVLTKEEYNRKRDNIVSEISNYKNEQISLKNELERLKNLELDNPIGIAVDALHNASEGQKRDIIRKFIKRAEVRKVGTKTEITIFSSRKTEFIYTPNKNRVEKKKGNL